MAVDHGIDDLELQRVISLRRRPVPYHLNAALAAGLHRSGMDGLPEQVRIPFRNDSDYLLVFSIATGKKNDEKTGRPKIPLHSGNLSGALMFCQLSPVRARRNSTRSER